MDNDMYIVYGSNMTSEFVLIDAVCVVASGWVQFLIYLMMFRIHTPAFGRFKHFFKYRLIFLILMLFTRFHIYMYRFDLNLFDIL